MRFRHLRGIIIALMATAGMLAVASCTSSEKEPEADFRVGPYYDYSANEESITKEGYEVSSRSVVFGKDYYVVLVIGYNDEIMEAEDRWYDSFGEPEFKVLPTDNEGNICVPLKELYFFTYEGDLINEVDLDEVQGYSREIPCITIDNDDHVHAVVCNGEIETGELFYYDLSFDGSGELIGKTDIGFDRHVDVNRAFYSDDGDVYYYCNDNETYSGVLYAMSSSGELLSKSECPIVVGSFVEYDDEDYIVGSVYNEEDFSSTACMIRVDHVLENDLTPDIMLPDVFLEASGVKAIDNRLLLWTPPYLYSYDPTTEEQETMMDDTTSDCPCTPYYFTAMPDGEIVFFGFDGLFPDPYLVRAVPTDRDPHEGREKLVIAGVGINNDPIILNMVKTFNMENDEYYFEIDDYTMRDGGEVDYDDPMKVYTDFWEDIRYSHLSDDTPDVIVDIYNTLPFSEIADSDHLVDLSQYIENDGEDQFLPWYSEYYDDARYTAFLAYQIDMLAIDSSSVSVDDLDLMDYDQYEQIALNAGFNGLSVIGSNKTEFLAYMVQMRIDDFYDIRSGGVRFDSEEFTRLIQWVNDNYNDNENYANSLGNGAFARQTSIVDADQISYDVDMVSSTNVSYVGYPSYDQDLIVAVPRYSFAITGASDHPDAAWELISLGYSSKYQSVFSRVCFPVNPEAEEQRRETQFDQINESSLRESYRERMNDIVDSVNCVYSVNNELHDIITEESSAYFYGNVSLEVVIDRIQNRANLVMEENYT